MTVKKICVLGLGDSGVPLSAVIALKCPEIRVTVVKTNSEVIFQWNTARIPPSVFVPGLDDFIRKCQNRNLFFSTNDGLAIKEAEIIFIVSESTLKPRGEGGDQVVNLSKVEETAKLVAEHAESSKVIVESSSIPLKAAECLKTVFKYHSKPGINFQVLSNPEFYSQGSPIRNLLFPSCVLIGSDETPLGLEAAKELSSLYQRWVPPENIIVMSNWSVELARICTSAAVVQTMASMYAISVVCEKSGGVLPTIIKAIPHPYGRDYKSLELNFNLGKLRKELRNLVYICDWHNLKEVSDYWREALIMYNSHLERFIEKILQTMHQTANKKIAVFGFAYYKDTHITEGSDAIDLCISFLNENAEISVYDPKVQEKQVLDDLISAGCGKSLENLKKCVKVHNDPYKATQQCQVLIALSSWVDFSELDYEKIYKGMTKPAYIFDYDRGLPYLKLSNIGFNMDFHTMLKAAKHLRQTKQ